MDEVQLQACVRAAVAGSGAVTEVKMFGGLGFMLNGNLLAGASRRGLLLRVGSEREAEALRRPGARPMVMRGRTMAGYVYVDPPALSAESVPAWLGLAILYVRSLPPKRKAAARRPARAARSAKSQRPPAHKTARPHRRTRAHRRRSR
jgi:TfoX/Sxy family transcriptional regulator of competence genes